MYTESANAMDGPDLQIWNNAAYDNGDSEAPSWSPLKPVLANLPEALEPDSSKENWSAGMGKSPVSCRFPVPVKPLHPNGAIGNTQSKLVKLVPQPLKNEDDEDLRDERKIDTEILEIETEIRRLSSRLEALRFEKANAKIAERRGKIVPAKFMEQNQKLGELKKMEEPMSVIKKTPRRAVSMGPSEILAGARRGRVSVGPQEIAAGGKLQTERRPEITPMQPIQSRRKSCFWNLQDIDEKKKVVSQRGKSLSPRSRKTISSKVQNAKQAATTIGGRKQLKKEEVIISSIQPKVLFEDTEKPVNVKKPLKSGRVVASRYNQTITQSDNANSAIRKRSLPGNGKEGGKLADKKWASSVGKFRDLVNEGRVKKRWEIPSSVVIYNKREDEEGDSPSPNSKMPDLLPRIRTGKLNFESPRDSGPAKRVSELIGKKPFFSVDEEEGAQFVTQALDFAEAVEDV